MEFLQYFLVSVLSFLGLAAGHIIISYAPEEQKPSKKYFLWLCHALFYGTLLLSLFTLHGAFLLIPLVFGVVYYQFRKSKSFQFHLSYIIFSVLFFLLSSDVFSFLSLSALIFSYGLSAGACLCDLKDKKKSFARLFLYSYFIAISLLLMIIP